ncbi:MAG: trigger factor [Chloroflexi bacterium]|nr:trigger factor [Chloroflexota bacterium]
MKLTVTPAPGSALRIVIELPPERFGAAINEAVRALSRRTRVPGFRPGKAPRVVLERQLGPSAVTDEALEHLVERAYRDAIVELRLLPLTRPEVDVTSAEEGQPVVFTATVPVRPEVKLGDYRNFNFRPEIETIDDARIDKVVEELRDQQAILEPVEDRGAENGDYAVIGFTGTRDGQPFDGGSAERMPLIIGEDRLIPGFEANLLGLRVGDRRDFDITFPDDYGEASLAGKPAHFQVELRELRRKVLPPLDDDLARQFGDYEDLVALRAEIGTRLRRNAVDKARHGFADRIIDYAVANADFELPAHLDLEPGQRDTRGLPEILVEQETEVMHDEFRSTLARQGMTEEAYLKVTKQSEADLHAEFRPRAEERVKVLLVTSRVAEAEGVQISDEEVEAEVARGRRQYGENPRLVRYFESDRGRNFIRSTLRRSRTVEKLIDDWLVAHPEHPPMPHAEAAEQRSVVGPETAASAGEVEVTDPASLASEVAGEPATETADGLGLATEARASS